MHVSDQIARFGAHTLLVQLGLLVVGAVGLQLFAAHGWLLQFAPAFAWSLVISLAVGAIAFLAGIVSAAWGRQFKDLVISLASVGFGVAAGLFILMNIGFGV